jgi:hypothetical protein
MPLDPREKGLAIDFILRQSERMFVCCMCFSVELLPAQWPSLAKRPLCTAQRMAGIFET